MATVSMFTLLVSFGKSCTFFEFKSQTDTIRKHRNLPRFDRIHMIPLLPSLLGFTGPTDAQKRELLTRELQDGRDPGPSCSAVSITGEGRERGRREQVGVYPEEVGHKRARHDGRNLYFPHFRYSRHRE